MPRSTLPWTTSTPDRLARRSLATAVATAAALAVPAAVPAAVADAAGGPPEETDGPVNVVYVEVNREDMANVADYTLAGTGEPVFDIAIVFAANVNRDEETGDAVLHLNERVTETLEDAENQIRPLQEAGTEVLLSVLGNHQGVGIANFQSPEEADAFAAQLADVVETYGLDGIDFDDEWSRYDLGEPVTDGSFVWLVTALRERLGPDKTLSLYNIGEASERTVHDGVSLGDGYLDYAWNPYYGSYALPQTPDMTPDQLGAAAVWIDSTDPALATELAERTVADDLGVFVTYDLGAEDSSAYLSPLTEALYGQPTAYRAAPVDRTRPAVDLAVDDAGPTVTLAVA